ncbi:putative tripartite motif-containing protein 75 [Rana temporaria]|uniref:putative tripartite motif-containing protein 75 n=1 Tax=Rana temporaria TaxID=8407 RepID=UPI001AAC530F|nr:putative tripartite motif-containing protein 75 [Rana temporaria]
MAFSDARKELDCSICLNIDTNPVTLRCGHNFCQECIEDVLDTQERSGVYRCPECREEFQERPELSRDITLRNIMESSQSTEPEKESQILCTLHGDHQGHQVEALEEASEKRKENLTNALQKLVKKGEEMEESIKSLQKYKRKVQDGAGGVTKRVATIFRDIRRQLDILERRILKEIAMKAERVSFPASELIQDLEIKKDNLSRKIRHIKEICNMTDPLSVLQESDTGLFDIVTGVNKGINIPEPEEITLDEDTANNYVYISNDKKTARKVAESLNRPQSPERPMGMIPQVMSSQSFSSGRHYWDVDVGGSSHWKVGMCYTSILKIGTYTEIGLNLMSWCLESKSNQLSAKHDKKSITLPDNLITRVRINLDYEAGQISLYELGIPIRHLHTFTAFFTEPLHVVFYVKEGCIKICRGKQEG